jgi:hypothetical protein
MALLTLTSYWTDETSRRGAALAGLNTQLAAARVDLAAARTALVEAGAAARRQADLIADLRRQLAAIPMPADGDPLLLAMDAALVAQAQAGVGQADADLARQQAAARVTRLEARQQTATADLAAARASLDAATARAATRQAMADLLTSGDLANLAADAGQALTDFEAGARAKVEAAFPANGGDAAKDFLTRVRDRRDLVWASAHAESTVFDHVAGLAVPAVDHARAAYDAAYAALQKASMAASRLAADRATLERLANLATPLVTTDEAAALKDPAKEADREDALTRLRAVDLAERARRTAQAAYDQALADLRQTDPDTDQASLDGGALNSEHTAVGDAETALATARGALTPADRALLAAWFAAVPDGLWSALEALDDAVEGLAELKNPTPAALIDALASQEDLLVKAIQTADLVARVDAALADARARAAAGQAAELDTAPRRARAMSRSAAAF